MNEEFRHKLLRWLISALLLVTISVLSLCTAWLVNIDRIDPFDDGRTFANYMAEPLGLSLFFYPYVFVPTFLWHLADFAQRDRPIGKRLRFLTDFTVLAGVVLLQGLMFVLQATGWFRITGNCGGVFIMLTQACWWTHPVVSFPLRTLFAVLWLLSLLKLAVAVRSRLRAPQ